MSELNTPVLLLIFNRLDTTQQVFEAIQKAKPKRLYIASDGPRLERSGEAEKIQNVRDYVISHIDWDCEVKTLFREQNLGCRVSVSSAIDWFFEHEEEGIILEDDCLPNESFFRYAEELLDRYREDPRVMTISSVHFHGDSHTSPNSYFFSRYFHCWGWASWRRAWQHYDHNMSRWPELRDTDWLMSFGNGDRKFNKYWTSIFDMAFEEKVDSWAYRWLFSCWVRGGLTIIPMRNLVVNIGFGDDATHTMKDSSNHWTRPLQSISFPLLNPSYPERDIGADQWSQKNLFDVSVYTRIIKKIMLHNQVTP
jgi:GR25 family glycosyltransferase involved in LPS biosynthesis